MLTIGPLHMVESFFRTSFKKQSPQNNTFYPAACLWRQGGRLWRSGLNS